MEFEFDKEIDAILRRGRAGGEPVASPSAHLGADEISAFAENVVPDAARANYTAHLADCARCRKILSNVILLNSEAETAETASSAVTVATAREKTPWYRKLFAFPQIAYTMGALVVLFSGFFGYLILNNLSSADRSVSYSANTTNTAARREQPAAMTNSNTTANTSIMTGNTPAPSNTPAAPNSAANTASNTAPSATPAERKDAPTDAAAPDDLMIKATPEPKQQVRNEAENDKELAKISPATPTNNQPSVAGATRDESKQKKEEKSSAVAEQNAEAQRDNVLTSKRTAPEKPRAKTNAAGESRSVGGKTFNNVGGIWFDAAYTNQKQKTVRRGTGDYQKLDAGLRSIADSLGGTVVVLWKGKAYRIQ